MNNEKPLVTIITATYNGGKYIEKAITGVLNQKFKNFEYIIVIDGSSDNTESILEKYKKLDSRINYLSNKENIGNVKSRNKGIELSKGDYIAILDDDDIWIDENKLSKQVIFLEKNKDYGIIGSSAILINEEGKKIGIQNNLTGNKLIKNYISSSNQFTHSSILIRKEALNKIGLFHEYSYAKYVEDYDLILRIGKKYKFENLKDYCVEYRIRKGSLSRKKDILVRINAFRTFIKHSSSYPNKLRGILANIASIILPNYIINLLVKINKNNIKN